MKRFFAKIARFFWSWAFLKFVLWTITIVILFYVEEDWRGARAWAATKAEWEAKGESFDFRKFIPPPVPDNQNLASIPAFKLEPVKDRKGGSYLDDIALRKALGNRTYDNDFPPKSDWRHGELFDDKKIQQSITAKYSEIFKSAPPSDDSVVQLDALFPFIKDLRDNAARPYCRFQFDDGQQMPAARPVGLIASQIFVSKILTLYALLELEKRQPDLALEDLKINFKLASAAGDDPSLVGVLVKVGMVSIGSGAIYDGLARHEWNDAQLAEIDGILKPINFLADYQFAMRAEVVDSSGNIDYLKNAPRSEMYGALFGMSDVSPVPFWARAPYLWPSGWWDQGKSRTAAVMFRSLRLVDAKDRRVPSEKIDDLESQYEWKIRSGSYAPWDVLCSVLTSFLPNQAYQFAQAQVWVDETRIACALERYRLAHNAYPDSLGALVSVNEAELPHDIMSGEPYHYRLLPDGTFLLYSVGGNEKDDGGKVVYQKNSPNHMEYTEGDWTWPVPQAPR